MNVNDIPLLTFTVFTHEIYSRSIINMRENSTILLYFKNS